MSEKFTELYSLPDNLFAPDVPVMLSAGRLFKNNQNNRVFAQLKLQNVSKNYKSMWIQASQS